MSKIGDIFGSEGWIGSIYTSDNGAPTGCLTTLVIIGAMVFGFIWLVAKFPLFGVIVILWPEILFIVLLMFVREGESFWKKPPAIVTGNRFNERYSVAGKITLFSTIIACQLVGISLSLKFGWEIYGSRFTAATVSSFFFSLLGIPLSFFTAAIVAFSEDIFIRDK